MVYKEKRFTVSHKFGPLLVGCIAFGAMANQCVMMEDVWWSKAAYLLVVHLWLSSQRETGKIWGEGGCPNISFKDAPNDLIFFRSPYFLKVPPLLKMTLQSGEQD